MVSFVRRTQLGAVGGSPRVRSLRSSTKSLQSAIPVDFVFLVLVAFQVSVFGFIAESFFVVAGRCVLSLHLAPVVE